MDESTDARVLTRDASTRLAERIMSFATKPGELQVTIESRWRADLHWGRNRITSGTDGQWTVVQVTRPGMSGYGQVATNQLDDASLQAVVQTADRYRRMTRPDPSDRTTSWIPRLYVPAPTWNRETAMTDIATCGGAAHAMIDAAERGGVVGAGYVAVQASSFGLFSNTGLVAYNRTTQTQCAMTARDDARRASGWAGASSVAWASLDPSALAHRAIDKTIRSRDPVAIEPGRYTAILEPQAAADFIELLVNPMYLSRLMAESGQGPFANGPGDSKLGMRVADRRVTIGQDPMTDIGMSPFDEFGEAVHAVNWIEQGTLVNLSYSRTYALESLNEPWGCPAGGGFHMVGDDATLESMIASTQRGVLVTRLSNPIVLDRESVLATGITRDGLWLIENGKISMSIKNLRFTESPLFVLNNIEQLGAAVPVFHPDAPVTMPAMKVRDFSFTSLSESV